MKPRADLVVANARVMTCVGPPDDPLGIVDDGAVICAAGRIAWAGPQGDLSAAAAALGLEVSEVPGRVERLDAGGRLVSPGLVDCHTHLVFAGNRAGEFALRARGATYQEIAAAGGGIAATLAATRAESIDELVRLTAARARRALALGVTTIEAKSGYDLTIDGEVLLLDALHLAGRVDGDRRPPPEGRAPVRLVPTLLCHVIPPEARADRDAYVEKLVGELVPRVAASRLAASVDVYCDEGAFTLAETRALLEAAKRAGLAVRAHVGQFADLGGAELCAELGALSADHLEQVSDAGIAALAQAGTVAVMLPVACVQLGMTPPPVATLRAAGVPLAVASDLNPGTGWCEGLQVPMWLATTHYGLTVEEAWLGVTRVAAKALGREDLGVITPGAAADLVVWDTDQPADLPYRFTTPLVRDVVVGGARPELP
jgi:imidazolonepropionase